MKINIVTMENVVPTYRNGMTLYYHALQELGHSVLFSEGQILSDYLNIFMFHTMFDDAALDALLNSGAKFGFISTEVYRPQGFFHKNFDNVGEERRYKRFIQGCSIVFTHYLDEYESYRELTDNVRFTPFGFHERCCEVSRAKEKLVDLYFFGSVRNEPYRAEMLKRLRDAGLSIAFNDIGLGHDLLRNSFIGTARATLNLIHRRDTRIVAYRVPWLANNRICAISNQALDRENYLQFCKSFPDDQFVEGCLEFVSRKEWQAAGDEMYDRLSCFPMSVRLEEALDTTRVPA